MKTNAMKAQDAAHMRRRHNPPPKQKLSRKDALNALSDQIATMPDGEAKAKLLKSWIELKGRRRVMKPTVKAAPAIVDSYEPDSIHAVNAIKHWSAIRQLEIEKNGSSTLPSDPNELAHFPIPPHREACFHCKADYEWCDIDGNIPPHAVERVCASCFAELAKC